MPVELPVHCVCTALPNAILHTPITQGTKGARYHPMLDIAIHDNRHPCTRDNDTITIISFGR